MPDGGEAQTEPDPHVPGCLPGPPLRAEYPGLPDVRPGASFRVAVVGDTGHG